MKKYFLGFIAAASLFVAGCQVPDAVGSVLTKAYVVAVQVEQVTGYIVNQAEGAVFYSEHKDEFDSVIEAVSSLKKAIETASGFLKIELPAVAQSASADSLRDAVAELNKELE